MKEIATYKEIRLVLMSYSLPDLKAIPKEFKEHHEHH